MSGPGSAAMLTKLYAISRVLSMASPMPTRRNAHQLYARTSMRYIRQIREALETGGIDWRAECREYQRLMRDLRKDAANRAQL
jgi:hypothetical protein